MHWLLFISFAHAATVEDVLSAELDRANATLQTRTEKPHYTALAVEDRHTVQITATSGTLSQSRVNDERVLDVDLRVGTPARDSTHPLRGFSSLDGGDRDRIELPLGSPDSYAVRHAIWQAIDTSYRDAAEAIVLVRGNELVKVAEEDPSPDFEPRTPVVEHLPLEPLTIDIAAWETTLTELSAWVEAHPGVHQSRATLEAGHIEKTFVDSEGTRLVHGRNGLRVSLSLSTTALDGDEISTFESIDVHSAEKLPTAEALHVWAERGVTKLAALAAAPRGTPYTGPVILMGRASAVFFHEVFGHRVEGQRQKRESEGRTFADYVGQSILPPFIDVYDDPTVESLEGEDLNGYYAFDDEGVPAQRAQLADDGKFVGFLMNRSPIANYPHSNGHGRRMAGNAPVARMGNTIVEASKTESFAKLKAELVSEVKKQGLEYGILVEEIDGGFTLTGRVEPNAFNVRASASWKVFADGRPDQLVRGIDLVGTPLVAFSTIIAASDQREVFNGFCGAESGWVPVSGVAPALLFRRLEFQLKEKGQERPPLLPKPVPPLNDGSTDGGGE